MTFKDQFVRTLPFLFNSFHYSVDRKNFKYIYEICKTKGEYPGFNLIGENLKEKNDIQDITLIMRHLELYELEELKPFILKAIDEGNLYPWHYGTALEYKISINPTIKEVKPDTVTFIYQNRYGLFFPSYLGVEFSEGNTSIVNSYRDSIGLETIEDQQKKRGKQVEYYFKYPPYLEVKKHRKHLGKMWKKGKPWKKK